MKRAFDLVLAVTTGVALAFLLLPLLALFLEISPAKLIEALGSDVALDAIWVTLKTGLIAHAFAARAGHARRLLPRQAAVPRPRRRHRAHRAPARASPAVAGIALLTLFGRRGLLGESLSVLGIEIAFTQAAVVIAVAFVAARSMCGRPSRRSKRSTAR